MNSVFSQVEQERNNPTLGEANAAGGLVHQGNLFLVDDKGNVFRVRNRGSIFKVSMGLEAFLSNFNGITLPRPGQTLTITF